MSVSEEFSSSAASAARGQNLLFLAPPSPAWALPVLEGAIRRVQAGGRLILLVPRPALDAWSSAVSRLAHQAGVRWHTARGDARALRLLRADQLQLLVLTPESALALVRRSALKMEAVTGLALAWPEQMDDEALATLIADLPKDAQRILISADIARGEALAERHARKAIVAGPLAGSSSAPPSGGVVRTAGAAWQHRAESVAHVIELLDPETTVVWAADRSGEAELRRAVPEAIAPLVTEPPEATSLIIAWDAPAPAQFAALAAVADVVLLTPPGTEQWAGRLARAVRPLRLPGFVDDVLARLASRRAEIARVLEQRPLESEVSALAPLFERYDASQVAAALYALWNERPAPPADDHAADPATARVWVSVGQRDNAGPGDLMAALVKELGVDRMSIGKIDVRESFSLVEVPAAEAGRIAERLAGISIRRRKLQARVDRGAGRPSGRGSRSP